MFGTIGHGEIVILPLLFPYPGNRRRVCKCPRWVCYNLWTCSPQAADGGNLFQTEVMAAEPWGPGSYHSVWTDAGRRLTLGRRWRPSWANGQSSVILGKIRTSLSCIWLGSHGVVEDWLWPTPSSTSSSSWDTSTLRQGWVLYATSDARIQHSSCLNSTDMILVSQTVKNQKHTWDCCHPNLGFFM